MLAAYRRERVVTEFERLARSREAGQTGYRDLSRATSARRRKFCVRRLSGITASRRGRSARSSRRSRSDQRLSVRWSRQLSYGMRLCAIWVEISGGKSAIPGGCLLAPQVATCRISRVPRTRPVPRLSKLARQHRPRPRLSPISGSGAVEVRLTNRLGVIQTLFSETSFKSETGYLSQNGTQGRRSK